MAMILTPQELAAMLHGREYRKEITDREARDAKEAALVVAFGQSDDLVEFRGAIEDEVDAYDGAEIPLTSGGLVRNECEDEDCPYFRAERRKATLLKAMWGVGGCSWRFDAPFPHITFDILEEGKLYCRGIVFRLVDVPGV